ncbi:MAG: hypothetical protein ACI9EP_000196 [Oceanospirillaceae bacterium]|jgi:hypothetical protein
MANNNDAVLMDYLSELLIPQDDQLATQPSNAPSEDLISLLDAQPCLQVKVGVQDVLLPLADLAGMQAICGPLISMGGVHWQSERYSEQVLLDLRSLLSISEIPYSHNNWHGHSLKIKQTQQSVLVDIIVGPVHSVGDEKWHNFNGIRYTLLIM